MSKYNLHYFPSENQMKSARAYYLKYFKPKGKVLDLGCGQGEFLELLQESGRSGQGVEVDANLVSICQEKGLEVVRYNAINFLKKINDKSWDGIFIGHLVEHLYYEDAFDLLDLAAKRLNPGGRLVVVTPNPNFLPGIGEFWSDMTHRRPYSLKGLKSFFTHLGLHIVDCGVDPATRLRITWKRPLEALINFSRLFLLRLIMLKHYNGGEIYIAGEKR